MEVNQEKSDNPIMKSSDFNEESPSSTKEIKNDHDKENKLSENYMKSDQSLFDMIKSRPKRPKQKVPSRLKDPINKLNFVIDAETSVDEKKPNQSVAQSTINNSLDVGLDTFFQSSSITFKRRTFADVYPKDEVPPRFLSQSTSKSKHNPNESNDKNNNTEEMNFDHDKKESKMCSLSIADKIARSRSSPNLIDPRKMLLPADPRHNLSMIKELRSRQKSGESTEISTKNNNNLNHHSSLLSELKAKNKPICSRKDAPSSVHKPPISLLKPSLKSISSSSSGSSSSTALQSGQFFNVKLRETKSSNLIKSHTRASFPVGSETDEKMKRNSEPISNQVDHQTNQHGEKKKDSSDSFSGGEDDKRLSKEASALNSDEKEKKNHRSSGESSSSEEEEEDEKKEDNEDDNCQQNGTKSSEKISC